MRTIHILYSATFALVLVALSVASMPNLFRFSAAGETTFLNGKLTHAIEKHYDKGFPVKEFGTNVWAAVEYGLFGEGRPGVVIGRDGWLFTSEEFKPATKPDQVEDNWKLITRVRDELRSRGIQLQVVLLPAKARLYPEFVAEQRPVAEQQALYDQARERLGQLGLQGADLYAALEGGKQQGLVFLRTDTHWTPLGAELAARAVADDLQRRHLLPHGELSYATRQVGSETHKGDLLSYLPLDPYFAAMQPAKEPLEKRVTEQNGDGAGGDLFGDSAPQVALVGTSYSANPKWNFLGALRQSLGTDLYNYAEDGHGPLVPMLRLLAKGEEETQGLKLVLWEVPERYLTLPSDLSEFDPQWLAQLGSGHEPAQQQLAAKGPAKSVAAP
ncbi:MULTISPECIES: alginate O-acetyltransferase [unclassified Pseudomonas]|uniref:alginate O-acetyltransferase n=1 Tax=unclassified Pseudomonas TaxID=196821 RepID=UPI00244708EB|nr:MULTISPECIES: alginate O-acetyltransferase [unclassified Pseudomonas]MDG9929620.1 alginate O-acetyltransferase [Pseudomonas sp. GD04042]MDH0483395.1 alginate O-acetyltransferase [Pseudomonas sp. GD04015]MDH0604802.1 alginate O-acetyltransferase [Pseudomonas sp. GD03869]